MSPGFLSLEIPPKGPLNKRKGKGLKFPYRNKDYLLSNGDVNEGLKTLVHLESREEISFLFNSKSIEPPSGLIFIRTMEFHHEEMFKKPKDARRPRFYV